MRGAVGFAAVVGTQPSVLRATIMAVLVLGALLLDRDAAVLNSLALAALIVLALRPNDLHDPGFQLSFAATAGIVLAPIPRQRLLAALGVSLAAQLAVLPIALVHFNQVSTIGVLANLAVVPLAGLATILGLFAVAVAAFSTIVAGWLFSAVWPVLLLLRWTVTLAAASLTIIARLTRSTMLDVLGQDFVRTARAKGVRESFVVVRHALRNALIPTVTVVGVQAGYLWQPGGIVFGVEGDSSWAKNIDYLASARGIVGVPAGPLLIYGTGGAAFEGAHERFTVFSQSPGIFDFNRDINKNGWVAGAGFQTWVLPAVSVGVEGLYYDMGSDTAALTTPGGAGGEGFSRSSVLLPVVDAGPVCLTQSA